MANHLHDEGKGISLMDFILTDSPPSPKSTPRPSTPDSPKPQTPLAPSLSKKTGRPSFSGLFRKSSKKAMAVEEVKFSQKSSQLFFHLPKNGFDFFLKDLIFLLLSRNCHFFLPFMPSSSPLLFSSLIFFFSLHDLNQESILQILLRPLSPLLML